MYLGIPSDVSRSPRICPVCGKTTDSKLCADDGIKTFALKTISGIFVKSLSDAGKLEESSLVHSSKMGYDLRIDFSKVKDISKLTDEIVMYLQSVEAVTRPKIILFSRDHRNHGNVMKDSFEKYSRESGAETILVDGHLPTTVSGYLGALTSYQEKKTVTAIHATASHNPPEYNGIKVTSGRAQHDVFSSELDLSSLDSKVAIENYVGWCTRRFSPYEGDFTMDLVNGAANLIVPQMASANIPGAKLLNNELLQDFGGLQPEPPGEVDWQGFGVTFDGDADRCPFYRGGKQIFFSRFLAGMVDKGLFDETKVVSDQRTPPNIIKFLEALGVEVIVGTIGNTNQMRISGREDALWFEENWHSGGYSVDGNRFPWEEAPFTITYWLDKIDRPIDEILEGVPTFEYREGRFKLSPGFNQRAAEYVERKGIPHRIIPPDGGIRVEDEGGHVLLRESNTEIGTVKLLATGVDAKALQGKLKLGRELVASIEGK